MTLALACIALLALSAHVALGERSPRRSHLISIGTAAVYPKPDRPCPGARRAIRYYRAAYAEHRAAMRLPGPPALVEGGCNTARTMAAKWRDLAHRARVAAHRWVVEQFHWWVWLPDKWRRVARCETGLRWDWDSGTYVSAFGIYRPGYADDAHRIGNLSWDETRSRLGRLPTPREQYEAALSHYRAHGGFSGWGCRGA